MRRFFFLIFGIAFLGITFLAIGLPAVSNAQQPPGTAPLLQKHLGASLNCAACHKENPPAAPVKMDQCLTCHGGNYDKLADLTDAKGGDHNPHASHNGDLPCESCHHVHKPSVNFCAQCHQFDFKVP